MSREKSMTEKWRDWRLDGEPFKNQSLETTSITEKKELGGALIDKIYNLTDMNNHNEARLVLAKQMKLKNLVKAYEALMVLHNTFNQMNELMKAREKLDKMLFTGAKRMYNDYEQIHSAF
tara:strand:+ start:650 stop:1009 length:360 start_codon:yes stop_codon:yes gene_type:complete